VGRSALEPVIEDRLSKVRSNSPEEKRKALLSIKVCDSASGSGAFLIAACNRLGNELARIISDEETPPQDVEQNSRREVLLDCICGVVP
jgi:type II restriction/modification system DNA methylase subunit YeeA